MNRERKFDEFEELVTLYSIEGATDTNDMRQVIMQKRDYEELILWMDPESKHATLVSKTRRWCHKRDTARSDDSIVLLQRSKFNMRN